MAKHPAKGRGKTTVPTGGLGKKTPKPPRNAVKGK